MTFAEQTAQDLRDDAEAGIIIGAVLACTIIAAPIGLFLIARALRDLRAAARLTR